MMGVIGFAAVGAACVSLVFSIISIALPYWQYQEASSQIYSAKYYSGLWTICQDVTRFGQEQSVCLSIGTDEAADFLKATRALEIIGLLLVAAAGVIGVLKLLAMKENEIFPSIAGGLAIVAGVFMIIGAIVYAAKIHDALQLTGANLHAGFALAIVSSVISFVAGGLFFASKSN